MDLNCFWSRKQSKNWDLNFFINKLSLNLHRIDSLPEVDETLGITIVPTLQVFKMFQK